MAKILVLYYSERGHTEQLAMAVAHGARSAEKAEVQIKRLAPIGKPDQAKPGSPASQIPIADPAELSGYDGILFGTPTRFGNMCAEMRYFLDQTSGLWASGGLVGRVAGVFVSSSSQHGGQESTVLSFIPTLLHHGMIIAGLPYTLPGLMHMDSISGGSPYGAGTISGSDDLRQPSDNEFDLAEAHGKRVATLAVRLYG